MKLAKQVYSLALVALFTNVVNLNSQVSAPTTPSSVGQAKADLIKSAFSSYLSGDTNQSRQYLMRASELDVEDVTVRRLLPKSDTFSFCSPAVTLGAIASYQLLYRLLLHSLVQVIRLVSLR